MNTDVSARGFIQYDGRLWRVIVDGHTVGNWTKRRWAKRDLRSKMRDLKRQERRRGERSG